MKFLEANLARVFICRLDYESDLLESLRRFAEEKGINAAVFSALGALKNASLAFYDQKTKKYVKEKISRPLELLSCIGNIAKIDGKTVVHAHIVVSDSEGRAYGGHLDVETIIFSCELFLTELRGINLKRKYDKTTGLNLFMFE